VWVFDADDIDGNGTANSAYSEAGLITTWDNKGSDPDSASIGLTSNDTYKPTFADAAINGRDAVNLDGVADHRWVPTSTNSAAFVHETGDFHFVFVMRPDSNPVFSTIAANTNTSADDGFIFWMLAARTVRILIPRGTGGVLAWDYTSTFTFTLGEWAAFEVVGSGGTTLRTAKNFGAFETQALLNSLGTGNAVNNWGIGASPPTADYPFDGAFAVVLVSDHEFSTEERAQVDSVVGCRYGI
jgi:hypothetical protein